MNFDHFDIIIIVIEYNVTHHKIAPLFFTNHNIEITMNEEQDLIYDDDEAVKFIQNYLPQELKEKFSDDDINYIIDLIYEYYESKGYFVDDNDDDDESAVDIDEEELIQYVINNAQKDGVGKYKAEEIALIVQGELEYCESIDIFE